MSHTTEMVRNSAQLGLKEILPENVQYKNRRSLAVISIFYQLPIYVLRNKSYPYKSIIIVKNVVIVLHGTLYAYKWPSKIKHVQIVTLQSRFLKKVVSF